MVGNSSITRRRPTDSDRETTGKVRVAGIHSQSTITRNHGKDCARATTRGTTFCNSVRQLGNTFSRSFGGRATGDPLLFSLLNSDVRCARSYLFQRAMTPAFAQRAEQSRCTSPRLRILRSPYGEPSFTPQHTNANLTTWRMDSVPASPSPRRNGKRSVGGVTPPMICHS